MEAIILKCPDFGRYHFGTTAPDSDTALSQTSPCIYSDTLFSALINLCAKVFPEEVEELVACFKSGAILLSSASYCLDIWEVAEFSRRIFFLPKPCQLDLLPMNKDTADRKSVKRIQYISKEVWEQGILPEKWSFEGCYAIDRKFLVHPSELSAYYGALIEEVYSIKTDPKIADHARKKLDNIFFQTDLYLNTTHISEQVLQTMDKEYEEGAITFRPHFYFLLDFVDAKERMKNVVYFLLDLLPDEGIGGAISTGCGKIEAIERVGWKLNVNDASTTFAMSVALVSIGNEVDLKGVRAKNMIVRGGRVTAEHGTLSRIKMADTGALIEKHVKGQVASLHKDKPYLRYGMAFPLAVHTNYTKAYEKSTSST